MTEEASLQGWEPVVGNEVPLAKVIQQAFTYRGDVSFDLVDGRTVVGYLFNIRPGTASGAMPIAEVIQTDTEERFSFLYDEVRAVRFTGRDMAAGQSLEAWQRRRSANAAAAEAHE